MPCCIPDPGIFLARLPDERPAAHPSLGVLSPQYQLADLRRKTIPHLTRRLGQPARALELSKVIFDKPVKIPSGTVSAIKLKMRKRIDSQSE